MAHSVYFQIERFRSDCLWRHQRRLNLQDSDSVEMRSQTALLVEVEIAVLYCHRRGCWNLVDLVDWIDCQKDLQWWPGSQVASFLSLSYLRQKGKCFAVAVLLLSLSRTKISPAPHRLVVGRLTANWPKSLYAMDKGSAALTSVHWP